MLKLGFFPDFKGADSVLLDGTPEDIASLSGQLGKFVASSSSELSIHGLAAVSGRHPAQLFAARSANGNRHFEWQCAPNDFTSIKGKLASLSASQTGHQYFTLAGTPAQLIVSVGEYGADWWKHERPGR